VPTLKDFRLSLKWFFVKLFKRQLFIILHHPVLSRKYYLKTLCPERKNLLKNKQVTDFIIKKTNKIILK